MDNKEPKRNYRVELVHLYTNATETIELHNMSGITAILTFVKDHPDYPDMYIKNITSL